MTGTTRKAKILDAAENTAVSKDEAIPLEPHGSQPRDLLLPE